MTDTEIDDLEKERDNALGGLKLLCFDLVVVTILLVIGSVYLLAHKPKPVYTNCNRTGWKCVPIDFR